MNRDDFSSKTKDMLARRAGFLCSNPDCRRPTVGASSSPGAAVNIGIAAHITAAASGGKRYNNALSDMERSHIDNGIWLCSSCAALIDRDEEQYTVQLLYQWKSQIEMESMLRLREIMPVPKNEMPFLEFEFNLESIARMNRGYSMKNPVTMEDGIQIIDVTHKPIIYWQFLWKYTLIIYNNSMYPAYNVSIDSVGQEHFSQIGELPRTNNLPQLGNIDIAVEYRTLMEGTAQDAEDVREKLLVDALSNIVLAVNYLDHKRNPSVLQISFQNGEPVIHR